MRRFFYFFFEWLLARCAEAGARQVQSPRRAPARSRAPERARAVTEPVAEDPGGLGSEPPSGNPTGATTIGDFRFAMVNDLPHAPAVDPLLLVADRL